MKQEDAALDVLQEAYIKAFNSLDQLQDAEKFAGWFSRIVATKALDELKKRKVLVFSQLQTDDEDIPMEELMADERTDNQPELAIDKEETSRLVQEIIGTLSDEQRICIMMFYYRRNTGQRNCTDFKCFRKYGQKPFKIRQEKYRGKSA